MTCEVFRQAMSDGLVGGQGVVDEYEHHLESCPACAELVRDLRFIAEQAKLLLPLRDPSPEVWSRICVTWAREESSIKGKHKIAPIPPPKKPFSQGRIFAACVVLIAMILLSVATWSKSDLRIVGYFGFGLLLFLMGYLYFLGLADESCAPFERINNWLVNEEQALTESLTHHMAALLDTMIRKEIHKLKFGHEREMLLTCADRIRANIEGQ